MGISLFGSSEVYRSRPDVLGRSARGPERTFSDVAPGKGLKAHTLKNTHRLTESVSTLLSAGGLT